MYCLTCFLLVHCVNLTLSLPIMQVLSRRMAPSLQSAALQLHSVWHLRLLAEWSTETITMISGVLGGIRGYTPYTNLRVFWQRILTSVIINKQGTFRPFAKPRLRIPTSIFSNIPLTMIVPRQHELTWMLKFCMILESTGTRVGYNASKTPNSTDLYHEFYVRG